MSSKSIQQRKIRTYFEQDAKGHKDCLTARNHALLDNQMTKICKQRDTHGSSRNFSPCIDEEPSQSNSRRKHSPDLLTASTKGFEAFLTVLKSAAYIVDGF
jgi:hypothetical protein